MNELLKRWIRIRVGEIIDYVKGRKPDKIINGYKKSYIPYLSTEYLRNNESPKFAIANENVIAVNEGDIILLWDGSNAGEFFMGKKGILSSTMVKIKIKDEKVNRKFLFYALKKLEYILRMQTRGTGVPHVDKSVLENITINIPPLPEQKKIAEILGTVDVTIDKVDQAIEKTERLKKGLMQELLTKGIGHKNFKETPIGKIPEDWEVVKLKNLVNEESDIVAGPFGSNLKVSDYRTKGVPIIRLQNIERNSFINQDIKYTSLEKAKELNYHSYKAGDLVLAKLGDPIGKTCTVPNYMGKGIVVADVVRIRLSQRKANTDFIEYMLNSYACYIQLRKETIGSTRPRVNISQIRDLKLAYPPIQEQKKIAEILSTVYEKIELDKERKYKLQRIKKGLMQDLLTGKRRVRISR